MRYKIKTRNQHWNKDNQPKRILALDGGGLRGILTLGYLAQIEQILKARHGGDDAFRLHHYYDLITGTSTGAIIAAGLAIGMTVEEITSHYFALGSKLFQKSLFRQGFFRAKYNAAGVSNELKKILGADVALGDPDLKTGLLIMTKRFDTGSPWPLTNNPKSRYYNRSEGGVIPNKDYPLWRVVRASTAAPVFFDAESFTIAQQKGKSRVKGKFVDGGVSPHNNPALQAYMYVSLSGYGVNWEAGADKLLMTSLGTGKADPAQKGSAVAAVEGVAALTSLMDDCAALVETMLNWMSTGPTPAIIDRELGNLGSDFVGGKELFYYARYNITLDDEAVNQQLKIGVSDGKLKSLSKMDAPANMDTLHEIGRAAAKLQIQEDHFPKYFDLA